MALEYTKTYMHKRFTNWNAFLDLLFLKICISLKLVPRASFLLFDNRTFTGVSKRREENPWERGCISLCVASIYIFYCVYFLMVTLTVTGLKHNFTAEPYYVCPFYNGRLRPYLYRGIWGLLCTSPTSSELHINCKPNVNLI